MDLVMIQDFFFDLQKKKYVRYLLILAGMVAAGAAGWGIYSYTLTKKAQDAQEAFSQALAEFEKNLQAEEKSQRWDEIVQAFDAGYEHYAQTPLGPYFLAYKAQALLYGNKPEKALEATAKLVASITKSSPLYYLYATKLALMKIDSPDKNIHDQGASELADLSQDVQNLQRDWAAYALGSYALSHGDKEKAIQIWSPLVARAGTKSTWGSLAQRKLALLTRSS